MNLGLFRPFLTQRKLFLQSRDEPIPLSKGVSCVWYPLLFTLTCRCSSSSCSTLIPWYKTIAPFSLIWSGPLSSNGRLHVRLVGALPIPKAPLSKPFSSVFGKR